MTPSAIQELRTKAYDYVLKQDYDGAIQTYHQARALAQQAKNPELAIQFLSNMAACHQAILSYREAMRLHRETLNEAKTFRLKEWESVAAFNIASLMQEMGEYRSAAEWLETAPLDGKTMHPAGRLAAMLLQVSIFSRLDRVADANAALARAFDEADRDVPAAIAAANKGKSAKWPEALKELRRAQVCSTYGQILTRLKRYNEAETYALEAFRIRSVFHDKTRLRDAIQLAILARMKGDYAAAASLLETARQLDPANRTPIHLFLLDRERAQLELLQGRPDAALPHLRQALARARAWRTEVLPTNSSFLNYESNLTHELQLAFLDALAQQSADLTHKGLREESFWVSEEARFASMRADQFPRSSFADRLPKEYWNQLARFQQLQTKILNGHPELGSELGRAESSLNRMELEVGLLIPRAGKASAPDIAGWVRSLPADETVFSYHLAEPHSLAWKVSRAGIEVRRIAGKKQLTAMIDKFRTSLLDGASQNETFSTGMELSKQLFGEQFYSKSTTPFWTMVLGQEISSLPVAALPATQDGSKFLIQNHSIRILPSALYLKSTQSVDWSSRAIGIGDAIFNAADQRLGSSQNKDQSLLQLNRLPASAKEVRDSLAVLEQRKWSTAQLYGGEANPLGLRNALTGSPDILHVSSHFVSLPESPEHLNVVLSPIPGRSGSSLFGPLDLNGVQTRTKLVVLSGCNSSGGRLIPGIGVDGLSRAFLVSGASTVVATLWPTNDSAGPLFPAFYGELVKQRFSPRSTAEALRQAQLEMIRRGGWMARPAYWAAYIAISKG